MRVLFTVSLLVPLAASGAFAQDSGTPVSPVISPPSSPAVPGVDYPGATWVPAAEGNFAPGNRPVDQPIDMVIVHDIEGPDTAAVNIFQRAGAQVSAHYIVGAKGQVIQMVREKDVGWHAGNRDINQRSIGIETHGYAYRPGFYSPGIYEAEAKLVRDITTRYNIPRDRTHIISHAEVPHPRDPTKFGGASGHTDPGPYWDWKTFMTLVRNDARLESAEIPIVIRPGEKLPAVVTLQNTGDDAWFANTAKNPRTGLQAGGPVVYLGMAKNQPSVLSSLAGWASPLYADVLKGGDVPSGGSAKFEFTLQGPLEMGEVSEELRLVQVSTAADGGTAVPFGATVPLKLRVVPWDISVAAPEEPDDATPPVDPAAPAPNKVSATPPPVATWKAELPMGGIWAVYVAPPKPKKVRKNEHFVYGLSVEEGNGSVTLESKAGGQGLKFLGYYRFPGPKKADSVSVTLDKAPAGVTAANAGSVRFVGPFPAVPTEPNVIGLR